jgi:hypothetical protein
MKENKVGIGSKDKEDGERVIKSSVLEKEEHVEITDELDAELEKLLHTNPSEGLSTAQAEERLQHFGRNGMPPI